MSIIELKSKDFSIQGNNVYITSSKTKKTPGILLIYAHWCSHCKHFMPTFQKLAAKLGSSYPCVAIEHSELAENNRLSTALDFSGFPTIKFFDQSGRIIGEYSGNRSESDLLQHICKMYHHCVIGK